MEMRQPPRLQSPRPQQQPHPSSSPAQPMPYSRRVIGRKWWAYIGVGVVLLIAGFVVTKVVLFAPEAPKPDRYQAVFLNNGQAFFGKLKNITGEYLIVESAYRAQTPQLPADATEQQKQATANNVSLVKVGKEVYGPENTVRIRADQVVYWQNLEPNSKVTKAINNDIE